MKKFADLRAQQTNPGLGNRRATPGRPERTPAQPLPDQTLAPQEDIGLPEPGVA